MIGMFYGLFVLFTQVSSCLADDLPEKNSKLIFSHTSITSSEHFQILFNPPNVIQSCPHMVCASTNNPLNYANDHSNAKEPNRIEIPREKLLSRNTGSPLINKQSIDGRKPTFCEK